jgi:DNA-binding MarR family transcriptional regulator
MGTMARVRANVAKAASDLELLLGRLRRRIRAEAPNEGITLSQMSVLSRVVRDGPDTASGLAAVEHVKAQSMALTVANLESQGLVARTSDPLDGRRILVTSTERGRQVVQSVRRSRQAWLARAIATCFSDEEQETLLEALALLERLVDWDPDAATPAGEISGRVGTISSPTSGSLAVARRTNS